jgi:SOS-response transcriptional repressor LexA
MGKIALANPSVKNQQTPVSQQTPKHFLNRRTIFSVKKHIQIVKGKHEIHSLPVTCEASLISHTASYPGAMYRYSSHRSPVRLQTTKESNQSAWIQDSFSCIESSISFYTSCIEPGFLLGSTRVC